MNETTFKMGLNATTLYKDISNEVLEYDPRVDNAKLYELLQDLNSVSSKQRQVGRT